MSKAASTTLAWSFKSDLSQDEMLRRLDERWPSTWSISDSGRHGDYVAGRLTPEAVARIYEDGPGFVVHLRFSSPGGDVRAQLLAAQQRLIVEVLPLVGARDVDTTEPLD
ncbi:uncharacterized protein SOCEGT47_083410 [Sorangium cellulosum]|uniref:Uncharacterized protein n=1 Tax=Sorangium cellulosum TaxID=56 RepID=A0A4P2QEX9_SORCE|nr:hypothetical protein [Sorangium cellulosum]AUX27743.1 uncharacterized protein SOCEGT47_083410 [Sorangium cellulosum]